MNFLQLLASGASMLNFNFQSKGSQSIDTLNKPMPKNEGFQKVGVQSSEISLPHPQENPFNTNQATIINQMLVNQRQELINRYLQLNIQLLEGQIHNKISTTQRYNNLLESNLKEEKEENEDIQKVQNSKKKIKKAVKCGHEDKGHYAKGLCNNCYHKYGRTKKPWNCPHQKLYAGGMCQNCYINMYNKKKREQTSVQQSNLSNVNSIKQEPIISSEQKQNN